MLIMHLSTAPLVGAPGAICRSLNMHAGFEARWAVLDAAVGSYDKMVFDLDLQWSKDREEIIDLVNRCDVLHLHNFIGLDSVLFSPINFRFMWKQGRPMVRHFHSTPQWISRSLHCTEAEVLACPIPKVVIAQFHERYFPTAKLVPNIVFPPTLKRVRALTAPLRIGYAPSRFGSARAARWDTKGYPETVKLLRRVVRSAGRLGIGVELELIEQVSHAECLRRKLECDIFIDDLVTGSYHLNTLEALSAGVACLTYLDRRTQQAITDLTGRSDFPALSVGLEHAHGVLLALCQDRDAVRSIGAQSRQWMARHWDPVDSARHFIDTYSQIAAAPHEPFARRFGNDLASQWAAMTLHDQMWSNRAAQWPKLMPAWLLSIKSVVGRVVRKMGLRK